jgi:hypothetical protein
MAVDLAVFEQIRENISTLDVDEIKSLLGPKKIGYSLTSPIYDPGVYLYRARKLGRSFNKQSGIRKSDISYPPSTVSAAGRVNRAGQSIFYASTGKEPVFFELPGLQSGDELILGFWKTTEKLAVSNIGYTQSVFDRLGASRACPVWTRTSDSRAEIVVPPMEEKPNFQILPDAENSALFRAFGEYFSLPIGPETHDLYKFTTAIGEMHLGEIVGIDAQFGGIIYPSTRMLANGDNIALLPWFVDNHLSFRKALHIRVDGRGENKFSISTLDAANGFNEDGTLRWLGRNLCWTLAPGQTGHFLGTAGRDEYGDYETGLDGLPVHNVASDGVTGAPIPLA